MGLFGGDLGNFLGNVPIVGGVLGNKKQNPFEQIGAPQLKDLPSYKPGGENAFISQQKAALAGMQGPQSLKAESAGQGPQSLAQFDMLRGALKDESQQASARAQDAINRRFASIGALNSGSAIKAAQEADRAANQDLQKQLAGIGAQEAGQLQQQQFAREESVAQRNAAREQFNASQAFQDKVFKFDSGTKLAQLDLAFKDQDLKQYMADFQKAQAENDNLINQFNLQLSKTSASQPKKGLIGGILSDIGGIFG